MPTKKTQETQTPEMGEHPKRYLITSADSGMKYWITDTQKIIEAYAEKCNAELIVLPKTERRNNTWVMFDAWIKSIELGDENHYAWIDADIIIAEDAPNLFELDDRLFFCQADPVKHINKKWFKNHGNYGVPNPRPYPVTAMVKWTTRHVKPMLEWVEANKGKFPSRFGDQELVAAAVYNAEVSAHYFPMNWHKMSRWLRADTKFFHFAGGAKGRKMKNIYQHCEKHKIKLLAK